MAVDRSAYAALGLRPGADAAAVERAYKALIKRYHPDRVGGDPKRAAEINRAYLELRGPRSLNRDLVLVDDEFPPARGSRWIWAALAIAGVIGLLFFAGRPLGNGAGTGSPDRPVQSIGAEARESRLMERPLASAAINDSIRSAVGMAQFQGEAELAQASRDCHHRLRERPSLEQLDRCAAFDDAVVQLQDRDPLRDQGPFSEIAVTGRQMSAATLLSNDSLAIDGRLDRIRLHVELALAPAVPPPPVENVTQPAESEEN